MPTERCSLRFFSSEARFKGVNLALKEKVAPEASDTAVPQGVSLGCMVF